MEEQQEPKGNLSIKTLLNGSRICTQGKDTRNRYYLTYWDINDTEKVSLSRYNSSLTQGIDKEDCNTIARFILERVEKEAKIKVVEISSERGQKWSYNLLLDDLDSLMRAHEWLVDAVRNPDKGLAPGQHFNEKPCNPSCEPYLIYLVRGDLLYYDHCCDVCNPKMEKKI